MPLYLDDLQAQQCLDPDCSDPACDNLVFSGRCHPGQPVLLSTSKGRGVLMVWCAICHTYIAEIAVAARPVN